jgi:hypothetical protein
MFFEKKLKTSITKRTPPIRTTPLRAIADANIQALQLTTKTIQNILVNKT